jgi:hypothetical protein
MRNFNDESDHELCPRVLVALPIPLHASCVVARHRGKFEILYYEYLPLLLTHGVT